MNEIENMRIVSGFVSVFFFMVIATSFDHVGLFTQVHNGGSRPRDESTGSAERRRLEDFQ